MDEILGRVLFEGYSLVGDRLVNAETGASIPNCPIEDLQLSVRAYNVLKREGIKNLSDFVGTNTATIMNYRNMGAGTLSDILKKLAAIENKGCDEVKDKPLKKMQIIAFRWQGKVLEDIPITEFSLSVRSLNRMTACRAMTARQFLSLGDISSITGLGAKSLTELATLRNQLLECAITGSEEEANLVAKLFAEAKAQMSFLYTESNEKELNSLILGCILNLGEERSQDTAIASITSEPNFCDLIEAKIEDLIKSKLADGITKEEVAEAFQCKIDLPLIEKYIGNIVESGVVYKDDYRYFFNFPSIIDAVKVLPEQDIEIITRRLNGENLEEIGKVYGLTRERIRQIVESGYDKIFIKNKRAQTIDCVKEDRYKYFYETYFLECDDFCEITSEGEYVWNYLVARYKNGDKELSDAVSDEKLSLHLRYGVQKFLNKDFLIIGSQKIHLNKSALQEYVLSTYCLEDTKFEDFVKLYNEFLEEYNLSNNKKFQITGNLRSFENHLSSSNKVLWKPNRRLRYYDVDGMDFSELLQTLNLKRFRNIELSAEKFVKEYPKLMEAYDLRDEYELHNLLRKIYGEDEYVNFSRNPTIKFGEFSRSKAVLDAIYLLSPVSADALANFLSEEYGFKVEFIKSNWFTEGNINLYYNNGIYSVDNKELPKEEFVVFKRALQDEFYYIDEIKEKYKSISKHYDEALISTYNLKRLGFTPYCNYVIKNTMSADEYFKKCLTADDIIILSEISDRYSGISAFYTCMTDLKDTREIIEFEPDKYVNKRRINNLGITDSDIQSFCDKVFECAPQDEYFTLKILFDRGTIDRYESLEYGNLFYSSLLRADSRFSFRKMNGDIVFLKGDSKFTRKDFLEFIIKNLNCISVTELQKLLENRYGLVVLRDDIFKTVTDSNILNYNPIDEIISSL